MGGVFEMMTMFGVMHGIMTIFGGIMKNAPDVDL